MVEGGGYYEQGRGHIFIHLALGPFPLVKCSHKCSENIQRTLVRDIMFESTLPPNTSLCHSILPTSSSPPDPGTWLIERLKL